jgi:GNAT superfamily N-acetyltransferase
MFVRADWTRRGLGRRILEECEAAAGREGFRRLALMSTLPDVPLYLPYGFEPREEVEITRPDGVVVAGVAMEKPVDAEAPLR